jgi:Helicase HerA, central domain
MSKKEKTLGEEISYNLSMLSWRFTRNNGERLWRLTKYGLLGFKDYRTVFGIYQGRQVYAFPPARNQHTAIKGMTGFGKSALAVNIAIQRINVGIRTLLIDPHGDPEALEKGASIEVYQRVRNTDKLTFLTVNQKKKVIGDNPVYLIGDFKQLNQLRDDLMNSLFYDSKASVQSGHEVPNRAKLVLDTAVYFHNAYADWLVLFKGKTALETKEIVKTRQITLNDLALLGDNPSLIDLFIEILGYGRSRYCRPDLVARWVKVRESGVIDAGLKGVTGRLGKIVSTAKSELFFESNGFILLDELKKRKSVLCDLSGLDEFTIAIVSKLILTRVYTLQKRGVLRGQTEFLIDEASNIEVPNLPQIITQGRKLKLALTLIYQFITQFSNPKVIDAINKTVVTKINFKNREADFNAPLEKISKLRKREFIFEDERVVLEKVRTIDMPPVKRGLEITERGEDEEELRKRMMTKQSDIYAYFTDV